MSWSISTTLNHDGTDLEQLSGLDRSQAGNQQCIQERDEQIDGAIRAAFQLIVDGEFTNAAEISVSMSGHANKEHKKDNSWSNEFINISVSIKRYQEDEPQTPT